MAEKTIGIIAAPEFPTDMAYQLKDQLPSVLSEEINEDISWEFEVMVDGITSVAEDSETLLNSVLNRRTNKGWDYTLCLTDIPFFFENDVELSRVNLDHDTAFLSLPALGWSVKKRVTNMIVQVIGDIHYKEDVSPDEKRDERIDDIFIWNKIRKSRKTEKEEVILRYLLSPKISGRLTLISGMTYDNKPWRLMPSLRSIFAIAFSSGAYGMIFPTLWGLANSYSPFRLAGLAILAIMSLMFWITQSHNLWEEKSISGNERYRKLYNTTTIITLLLAIGLFHIILVLLFLITAFFLVSPSFYIEQLGLSGDPSFLNYLQLAWMTASVGTITGAIGVGLEDEENVRQSTYGYRQQQRYEIMEERREEEEEKRNDN